MSGLTERLAAIKEFADRPFTTGIDDADQHICDQSADIQALLAAVEAVLALHKPRIEECLTWTCAYGECDCGVVGDTQECPTEEFAVCEGCDALAREVNPDYGEDGVQEIAYPCATVRAIEEAA